ncbi:MAG: DMT family transporter [Chloroflexi bacterium]|nr:DMT family transporter [Chloroflexota bacterium]
MISEQQRPMVTRGAAYGLTAAAIWGGMYVVSDLVLVIIPPFTLLTIRLILGAVVLGLLLWRTGRRLPPRAGVFKALAVGFVGFGISVGAQFVGTDLSNAVNGALVTSASPAFILLFAALILRERLTLRHMAAVALASIGVAVILDLAQADFSSAAFSGNLVLVVAAVTWGLYSVLIRWASGELDTLVMTFLGFLGGLLLTIPAALLELTQRPIGTIDFAVFLGILYLGIISTAGAMWLWNSAFALVDASIASLFFFAQPLVGALLGALLGQAITMNLLAGGVLIALGVLLSLYRPRNPFPSRQS